jgi:hypothetical protein
MSQQDSSMSISTPGVDDAKASVDLGDSNKRYSTALENLISKWSASVENLEIAKILRGMAEHLEEGKPQPVLNPDGSLECFMPKVRGETFRCSCGCNVFHKPDDTKPDLFACNSCPAVYASS